MRPRDSYVISFPLFVKKKRMVKNDVAYAESINSDLAIAIALRGKDKGIVTSIDIRENTSYQNEKKMSRCLTVSPHGFPFDARHERSAVAKRGDAVRAETDSVGSGSCCISDAPCRAVPCRAAPRRAGQPVYTTPVLQ